MKASKFSDAQKAYIVKRGEEGVPVAEMCRKAGISEATYYNWRKKYAGLMPSKMRRLRELEQENARLREIVADWPPDKEMLQVQILVEVIPTNLAPGSTQTAATTPMASNWSVSTTKTRAFNFGPAKSFLPFQLHVTMSLKCSRSAFQLF